MEIKQSYISNKLSGLIFDILSESADALQFETYVIGGYVRDLILRRTSKDIDVVCVGSGIELALEVARRIGKSAHLAFFKNYGTAQVKYHDVEIEFVGARKESYNRDSRNPIVLNGTLQDDLNRRDFTINAIALCLNHSHFGKLIDPFNGLEDIDRCLIQTPLDANITFNDDPLRMLRAVRFASQLGFSIEYNTFEAIKQNKKRIEIVSKERVLDELNKIILSPCPSVGFELLEQLGLLELILPELAALKGVETKENIGHKDNFSHTLRVLDNLSRTTNNLWLRWTALFHDIGKPYVKQFDNKLGWTFHGHEYKGMKMLKNIFRRMKLPLNDTLKYIEKLISLHMRPIVLAGEEVTDSAIRRLLFEAGDDIDDLMLLCEADITSKNPRKVKCFLDNFKFVRSKLKEVEKKDRIRNFQPPVDGLEIMEILHLPPCRLVGELKATIKDAILDGIIPNEHESARNFLLQKAAEKGL